MCRVVIIHGKISLVETEKQNEDNSDDEMSDDPFASSGDESSGEEIQQLLLRKSTPKPVNIKPASKQSIIDWVASTRHKIGQKPDYGNEIIHCYRDSTSFRWKRG